MSPPEPTPLPKFEDYPNLYGWATQNERGYKIQEHPCGTMRPMRVIHIGAGLSGICLAKLIPDALKNVTLTCYDKNSDVGGTWFENLYVAYHSPPLDFTRVRVLTSTALGTRDVDVTFPLRTIRCVSISYLPIYQ